ncbi:MAG: HAMP domain-containing protein [Chloroflexi bacterium]|nr:HAMP domain-containing protein [Chloroflexota bacterium]
MNRLWFQLSLAFLVVTLVGVGLVAFLAGARTDSNFRKFLAQQETEQLQDLADQLAAYYQDNSSWDGIQVGWSYGGFPRGGIHQRGRFKGDVLIADANGYVVYAQDGRMTGTVLDAALRAQAIPIVANGQTVGYAVFRTPQGMTMPLQNSAQQFFEQLRGTLVIAGLLAGMLSIALGIGLSRTLSAPLANLATAAHRFAARDWQQRVPVRGAHEVAEVATAFNRMADDLERQETTRRNMIADIAHELRTPLAVMQGNLHAMLDQVYPLDRSEIATLYDETRLLARLVDDLRELALADAGQLQLNAQSVKLDDVLQNAAANFSIAADAQNVRVTVSGLQSLPRVRADSDRVAQVLRNLLANALRHTPEGGTITLGAQPQAEFVRVTVRDTGEGIAPQDVPHVFERFYRADKSRTRTTGGTGLGLAIAKAWVEAMGGRIGVESEAGRGSEFWFTLPSE